MAIPATQIRRGMVIVFEGQPCKVVEFRHHTPGNLRAMVQTKLRNIGFEVVEGRDLDKRAMEDKIREFSRKLDNSKLALFFYAGHGLQVGGREVGVEHGSALLRLG